MKRTVWASGVLAAITTALALLTAGCGTLAGGLIASTVSDSLFVLPAGISDLSPGQRIGVTTYSGGRTLGAFRESIEFDGESYKNEFRIWRERVCSDSLFPAPGDTVFLYTRFQTDGVLSEGRVWGADSDAVYVGDNGTRIAFADVSEIADERGKSLDVSTVRQLSRAKNRTGLAAYLFGRGKMKFYAGCAQTAGLVFQGIDLGYLVFKDEDREVDIRPLDVLAVHLLRGNRVDGLLLTSLLNKKDKPPGMHSITIDVYGYPMNIPGYSISDLCSYPSWFKKNGPVYIGITIDGAALVAIIIALRSGDWFRVF